MRKGVFIGLVLIGLLLIFLPVLPAIQVTRISTVFDTSFVLEPGEKLDPYEEGLCYERNYFTSRCVLTGVVSVEGEGILLQIKGYPSSHWKEDNYIDREYNFTIFPEEGVLFIFDNTKGNATSSVKFLLKEEVTKSLVRGGKILSWWGFVTLFPLGLFVLIMSCYRITKDKKISR